MGSGTYSGEGLAARSETLTYPTKNIFFLTVLVLRHD